jgi:hypothetical protein
MTKLPREVTDLACDMGISLCRTHHVTYILEDTNTGDLMGGANIDAGGRVGTIFPTETHRERVEQFKARANSRDDMANLLEPKRIHLCVSCGQPCEEYRGQFMCQTQGCDRQYEPVTRMDADEYIRSALSGARKGGCW